MMQSRGFTLLELMLAVVLFAVGTVAAMDLMRHAGQGSADGENTLIALHLARRRLEELRNVPYASLADESRADVSTPSGFTHFERTVEVTEPATNLSDVLVTVYWTGPSGETNVSLRTARSAN